MLRVPPLPLPPPGEEQWVWGFTQVTAPVFRGSASRMLITRRLLEGVADHGFSSGKWNCSGIVVLTLWKPGLAFSRLPF